MKGLTKLLVGGAIVASTIFPGKASAQTPEWYQAFQPRNEVVSGLNSYGIPNLDNDNDLDWDDHALIKGSPDPRSDVDADGVRGTDNDAQVFADWLNGNIAYLPGEYWRSTPSERENWFGKVYPIATQLNNHPWSNSTNEDSLYDSDRGALQDLLTLNGYNPNRSDFNLIHSKYKLDYNGLFNLPVYIARVHSDDGNFNHGIIALFKGSNLNNPDDWIFADAQLGRIVEPGVDWSIPNNSRVDILGIKDFQSAYDVGLKDLPWLTTAASIHFDSQGNREMTYLNENMIEDESTLGVGDEKSTPQNYTLEPNYPNPFNASTTIPYSFDKEVNMSLDLYNIKGQHIRNLEKGVKYPGNYVENLSVPNLPSGNYIVNLETEDRYSESRIISLVK